MSRYTEIQWADSTANPTYGCDGCDLWSPEAGEKRCYAGVMTERFGQSNMGLTPRFELVVYKPGQMSKAAGWPDLAGVCRDDKPWLGRLPRHVFVSDMGDALSQAVSFEYLETEIINVVASSRGCLHRWLWLTKRPDRMAKFSKWLCEVGRPWPRNLYVGTTLMEQKNVALIKHLERVGDDHTTRFLSVEPQWGPIDLDLGSHPGIGWVIQGGETGAGARPFALSWAYEMIGQCRAHGVPYFLKQLGQNPVSALPEDGGMRLHLASLHGGDWAEWPAELRVRQVPSC